MNNLILTILKDEVFFNNRYRIGLKNTNIPRIYGTFNGGFYWLAEIIRIDEDRRILHARITNYEASKDEFISSALCRSLSIV